MTRPYWTRMFFAPALAATLSAGLIACGDDTATSGDMRGGSDGPGTADASSWGGAGGSSGNDGPHEDAWSGPATDTGGPWGGSAGDASDAWGGWADAASDGGPTGNTNVNLGGSQDFGYFRRLLDANQVPHPNDFDASGFFAEHHTPLPAPDCGERICLQSMLGVLSNLMNGNTCTLLQIGLNSPLVADPGNRPPLDMVVVVDTSGSMDDAGKMDFVNQGLDVLIDSLHDGDRVALVTYATDAELVVEMTDVTLNRRSLREAMTHLAPGGGTNLYAGLELGYQAALATYDSGRQTRVVLLSDGQPTAGITSEDGILSMSAHYNTRGLGITTIGLGTAFNLALMRGLAEQGDGNFYFLESAAAVEEVFEEELSYFTVPVAYDLVLELDEGADYRVTAVHGTRLWQVRSDGGRLEIPSVFLAHRESHDDVTDGGGRRGGGSALLVELMPRVATDDGSGIVSGDVGTAHLTFREPGTDRIVEQDVSVSYPYAPWILLDRGHFDAPHGRTDIIQKSFVMLNIYIAMEVACATFHRVGVAQVEVENLRNLVAAVEDYNEELGDVDMEYDLALMRQLIDVLVANGADPAVTWESPDDPWPCD